MTAEIDHNVGRSQTLRSALHAYHNNTRQNRTTCEPELYNQGGELGVISESLCSDGENGIIIRRTKSNLGPREHINRAREF